MKKIKKALKNTAKSNGATLKDVKKEISVAIAAAMENSQKNPEAEAFWNTLTKNKKRPTPEDVVTAICEKISKFKKLP